MGNVTFDGTVIPLSSKNPQKQSTSINPPSSQTIIRSSSKIQIKDSATKNQHQNEDNKSTERRVVQVSNSK